MADEQKPEVKPRKKGLDAIFRGRKVNMLLGFFACLPAIKDSPLAVATAAGLTFVGISCQFWLDLDDKDEEK